VYLKYLFSICTPLYLYGIEIYANKSRTHIDKLVKLNNTSLRILQNQTRRCHVIDLYNNYTGYDTQFVTDLHKLRIFLLVQKYVHHRDKLSGIYKNYFLFNNDIHSYNTRSASNIHLHIELISVMAKDQSLMKYVDGWEIGDIP